MLDRQHTQTITVGDVSVTASISPCCWMYPGHGLQIRVALPNGGSAYVHDAAKPFDQSCEADVDRLLKQVRVIPCSRCGGQAFDPASVVTNRNGLCEGCFLSDLDAEFAEAKVKEQAEIATLKAKMIAEGCTHRVDAWIRTSSGDDRQVSVYYKGKPSTRTVKQFLKKEGSEVLDDYLIVLLKGKGRGA